MVQIGLGYVNGLRKDDATAVVSERERSGRFSSLAELASRAGIRDEALGRLAWAGACESIEPDSEGARREARRIALWRLGVASGAGPRGQLSLPLPLPDAPELRELDDWEVAVADYASTGMTLGTHPVALLRDELDGVVPEFATWRSCPTGARWRSRASWWRASGRERRRGSCSCCSRTRREWRT